MSHKFTQNEEMMYREILAMSEDLKRIGDDLFQLVEERDKQSKEWEEEFSKAKESGKALLPRGVAATDLGLLRKNLMFIQNRLSLLTEYSV